MRIEIYVAVDGAGNHGVGLTVEDAIENMDNGNGPDRDQPVAIATLSVEMNVPKIIEGPLVVVPDAKVQTIQLEFTTTEEA